ncbi:hypothetical protein BGZ97_005970, partial [Linnemannia gamsii]
QNVAVPHDHKHPPLFCLGDGEATTNTFSVKIPPIDTVNDLRKRIKAEIPDTFNGVDAKDLTLWRVSHPFTIANKHQPVLMSAFDFKTELYHTDDISEVFAEARPKKTIYIIVQRPPLQGCGKARAVLSSCLSTGAVISKR